jgi:gas vesicle protein
MGKEPSDIRTEIEQTRERVGDEVDAISYKTDVPARMGDFVDNKKQAVTGKLSDVKDAVAGTASNVLPDGERVGRLKDTAERNPLGLAVGGVALGFVAGLLLPSTRVENKAMGETSDKITDAVKETASDAIESGKQVAQDATDSAKTQAHDIASTLQDRTQETLTTPSQTTASG